MKNDKWNYKSFITCLITFCGLVLWISCLDNKVNYQISFSWMNRQAELSSGKFDLVNILSYPYYLFRLESPVFCFLFFAHLYKIWLICGAGNPSESLRGYWKKIRQHPGWLKSFPFMIVIVFMVIFTFPQEKGVRYLCVVTPFMAIAVATIIDDIIHKYPQKPIWILTGFSLLVLTMVVRDVRLVYARSDYQRVMQALEQKDNKVKILASQYLLYRLYSSTPDNILENPKGLAQFIKLYKQGYRYLIIDPQTYITFTKDKRRFSRELTDFLGFIESNVPSFQTYPHFQPHILERFVLEHNENLKTSLKFLRHNENNRYGLIKVYDMKLCIYLLDERLKVLKALSDTEE